MLGHRLVTQHLVPSSRVKGARQRIRLQTSRRFFFSVLDCAICSQAVPKQFPLQVEPQGSLTTSVPRIASCQLITLLLHNTLPIHVHAYTTDKQLYPQHTTTDLSVYRLSWVIYPIPNHIPCALSLSPGSNPPNPVPKQPTNQRQTINYTKDRSYMTICNSHHHSTGNW